MQDLQKALATVRAVAGATQGDHRLEVLLDRACEAVCAGYGFDRVVVFRLAGDAAVVVAAAGLSADMRGLQTSLSASPLLTRACAVGGFVYSADAAEERSLHPRLIDAYGTGAVFALPLLSEGRCIGLLAGDHGGAPFQLDEAEVDLLDTIGVLVATLLEKELLRDQLRKLDEAKTQFVALASHELRTPIQTVYGVLATLHLRGGELQEKQLAELRALAYEQAERLRRLAEQLLDLSRLDAEAPITPKPTLLRRKLEEIVLLVAERRAPEVVVDVPPDLELDLDPHAFDRIVSNLLVNAFRYGAPPVRIEAGQHDRHLRVSVSDAGKGVPPAFIPRLFDRFSRDDQATDRVLGSGLGLAIAQSFARAHGGEIVYRPAEPHGACFEFVLPVERR